jgi:nitrogen fixation protein NifZ
MNVMQPPVDALYPWGLRVVALDDLCNDGSFQDQPEFAVLVERGSVGEIVNIGHAPQLNEPVYLVEFGRLLLGCYEEEIAPAPAGLLPLDEEPPC